MSDESNTESQIGDKTSRNKTALAGKILGALALVVLAWFVVGGRINYAAFECSKGVKQCVVGIAVALGLMDVYDRDGRCTGVGCNF